MDKIFIPTMGRPDHQIAYEQLPDELKAITTLVVQDWDRPNYKIDCDYLVLPPEINPSDYLCLAKTRDYIHRHAGKIKYVITDDDLILHRRNSKYAFGIDDMEKSKRVATGDDILEFYSDIVRWMDEDDITFVAAGHIENIPPRNKSYQDLTSCTSYVAYNGERFHDMLDELNTVKVRYSEDSLFILSLLSEGFKNRCSMIYCVENKSVKGKEIPETVWKGSTYDDVYRDHKIIADLFPDHFKIPLDENGERIPGGYRDFGKLSVKWNKCFKDFEKKRLTLNI